MCEKQAASPREHSLEVPNAHQEMRIARSDLPLHCPMPNMRLWDSHPKVYLPVEATGRERCPYCGTVFILEDF